MFKRTSISYHNLGWADRNPVYHLMAAECQKIFWVRCVFELAWQDFKDGKFVYDGATFVRERTDSFWETAAFIHDWLNGIGYVGKHPDIFFIKIMIALDYPVNLIFERSKWMQWTWINTWRHKVKGTFVADDVPEIIKEIEKTKT